MSLRRFAVVLVPVLASGCSSAPEGGSDPARPRLALPENPSVDASARAAVAVPTEILASKIELYLPPGLYSDLEYRPFRHEAREYGTEVGRRISLRPAGDPKDLQQPARVTIGAWKLASFGPIEVLFASDGGPAARLEANGVDLLVREGRTRRALSSVSIAGERVDARETP